MKSYFIHGCIFLWCLSLLACSSTQAPPPVASMPEHQHAGMQETALPAFFKDLASIPKPLPATLSPDKFQGASVRKAYQAAQEIPETLAQLPCFCYCDRAFGHKSLHSCYETDHSASCSTCMDEALLAYQLQKEQGLSAAEVRTKIITEFGPKQQ